MSDFPEMYDDSRIKEMYDELKVSLADETIELLHKYFEAMANFYSIIPLRKAFEIISEQNPGLVTEEDFIAFSEVVRHDDREYYILGRDELYEDCDKRSPMDREILLEYLVEFDFDEYYKLTALKADKPYYVPEKEQLLKYSDDLYDEITPHTKAMTAFFQKEMHEKYKDAVDLTFEIVLIIIMGDELSDIFDDLQRMGVIFTRKKLEKFIPVFTDLYNNTRMPCHNGHTPNEINDKRDFTKSALEYFYDDDEPVEYMNVLSNEARGDFTDFIPDRSIKVKPNEPCPCGSGKKYKKCCGIR